MLQLVVRAASSMRSDREDRNGKTLVTAQPNTTLLLNASLVLPDRVSENTALLIEGDRIARILETSISELPPAGMNIDLEGAIVFPGFIDIHTHGSVGVDTMEADAADLGRVSTFLAHQGVTGWLPTLVPAPVEDYARAVRAIGEASRANHGARVLGVHYEGPFVNSAQCGALRTRFFRSYSSPADVSDIPLLSESYLKHFMTFAPEVDGGIALTTELIRRGWILSIGHTRAQVELLDQACEAGARHMTHFMNAMTPLHHRNPGPVAWGLLRDDVSLDFIADGIHLDSKVLQLLLKTKTAEGLTLISDAVAAAGLGDGDYKIWGETITVSNGRTRNAHGSIAGSVISMLDAVRLMRAQGASEPELARMASRNPARLLGLENECGSIQVGKCADLVALDQNWNVKLTMVRGRIVSTSVPSPRK